MMIDIISADKQLADELEIPEGTSVARIQRLQLADEEPVTLMEIISNMRKSLASRRMRISL